ncbi:hypothetical protein Droror1_Dr00005445 [Drosera rotundifolia]
MKEGEAGAHQNRHHIVIVPSPGIGHLIPLAEFGKRILKFHDFSLTFLIPTDGSPTKSQASFLETLPNSFGYEFLPPPNPDNLPLGAGVTSRILHVMNQCVPAVAMSIRAMTESSNLVAIVIDLFGTKMLDLAQEFRVPAYLLYTCSAFSLGASMYLPKLHDSCACEYRDLPGPVKVFPGSVLVHGVDFTESTQDRKAEAYRNFLGNTERYKEAAGIIVNSFQDLEPAAFNALSDCKDIPPTYAVGPLIQTCLKGPLNGSEHSLQWLDEQPSRSVLFVSFGSGGTLSHEQLKELAFGLEMSGQRFLWVIKSPSDRAPNASYFSQESIDDPFRSLPDGFLDRTSRLGLVVSSWAPQIQILSHGSTAGFLSHCGWNSTLESIANGVPLIAWPLFAEQRLNAVELADDLKVAIRVKPNEFGIVERQQVADCVKELIEGGEEGKSLRKRMQVLRDSAEASVGEGGQSTKRLEDLVHIWKARGVL